MRRGGSAWGEPNLANCFFLFFSFFQCTTGRIDKAQDQKQSRLESEPATYSLEKVADMASSRVLLVEVAFTWNKFYVDASPPPTGPETVRESIALPAGCPTTDFI